MLPLTTQQRVAATTLLSLAYFVIIIIVNQTGDGNVATRTNTKSEINLSKVRSGNDISMQTLWTTNEEQSIVYIDKTTPSESQSKVKTAVKMLKVVTNSGKKSVKGAIPYVENNTDASLTIPQRPKRVRSSNKERKVNYVLGHNRKLLATESYQHDVLSDNSFLGKTLLENQSAVSQYISHETQNTATPEGQEDTEASVLVNRDVTNVFIPRSQETHESILPDQNPTEASIFHSQTAFKTSIRYEETIQDSFSQNINAAYHSPSKNPEADNVNLLLVITVNVTGVTVSVDGRQVYSSLNKTSSLNNKNVTLHSGLHFVTLHQRTGQVMAAASYMTWLAPTDGQFIESFKRTQNGRLLIVMGAPDFTLFLEEAVVKVLEDMGALYINRVAYKDVWCMLVHKGGGVVLEALTTSLPRRDLSKFNVSPLTLHVSVPGKQEPRCGWYGEEAMHERADFCQTYEGYGNFCSCYDIPWSPLPQKPVRNILFSE
ncbi:uncharacterized protein [Cherax quadricarinatus]|uniref:uncharacterized protein n=1 Tax=Cherax quadricarinatus TaxID=27406 RepID=UPI00387EDE47